MYAHVHVQDVQLNTMHLCRLEPHADFPMKDRTSGRVVLADFLLQRIFIRRAESIRTTLRYADAHVVICVTSLALLGQLGLARTPCLKPSA